MRRALVLGNEAARHPFRRTLPMHVTREVAPHPFGRRIAKAQVKKPKARQGFSAADIRDFLLAYCACFVAVSAFIW